MRIKLICVLVLLASCKKEGTDDGSLDPTTEVKYKLVIDDYFHDRKIRANDLLPIYANIINTGGDGSWPHGEYAYEFNEVTLTLESGTTGAKLMGTTLRRTDSSGLASFEDLSIDKTGEKFVLKASAVINDKKLETASKPFTVESKLTANIKSTDLAVGQAFDLEVTKDFPLPKEGAVVSVKIIDDYKNSVRMMMQAKMKIQATFDAKGKAKLENIFFNRRFDADEFKLQIDYEGEKEIISIPEVAPAASEASASIDSIIGDINNDHTIIIVSNLGTAICNATNPCMVDAWIIRQDPASTTIQMTESMQSTDGRAELPIQNWACTPEWNNEDVPYKVGVKVNQGEKDYYFGFSRQVCSNLSDRG